MNNKMKRRRWLRTRPLLKRMVRLMEVPYELIPTIRELIAKHQS
jgi:hypothetical protein